ncbi:aspartate-alanine antiporter [Synergistales bacterium]|nr:aspartate-alanine antiporter [Synergistales bacterium]
MEMETVIATVHSLFSKSPEIAIFVSLALGFAIGSIPFGSFRLGGVAGSLLVGVAVSQLGVSVDNSVKNILFAIFIFAVGFESGPQFFRSLGKKTLREVALALIVAISALITVVALAKFLHLDKGIAAGIAAGGLTQSAIMGVAADAIGKLGLSAEEVKLYTANVGVGYAVTYIFGTLGAIIVCANILPKFMGKSLRDAAVEEEATASHGAILGPEESQALHRLVGRVYRMGSDNFSTVQALEDSVGNLPVTVEKVKRGNSFLHISPDLNLKKDDIVLLVGQRDAITALAGGIGVELNARADMDIVMKTQEVIVSNKELFQVSFADINGKMKDEIRHGVYILSVARDGKELDLRGDGHLMANDIIKLYGSEEDVRKAVGYAGHPIIPSNKTDLILTSIGIVCGLLIGMASVKLGDIPLTLGSGGGVLLSGLFFGWLKGKRPNWGGTIPGSASQFLKDFGLAGFVAVVGLDSGLQAITTIKAQGAVILVAGLVVTILPLLIAMFAGRYLLGYKNSAVFAGSLTGSRSANPAFGQILGMAGNSVPTIPFAITYALANVFLTLLGSLIVALV